MSGMDADCATLEQLEPRLLLSTLLVDDTPGEFQEYSTIQAAVNAAKAGDVILVKEGVYREAVTLSTSGTGSSPIILRAYPGDEGIVVLSGASEITNWRPVSGPGEVDGNANWQDIYVADVSAEVERVYQDGVELSPSRFGDSGYRFPTAVSGSSPNRIFYDSGLPGGNDYFNGATIHIKGRYWEINHTPIADFDAASGKITLQWNTISPISTSYGYFITNIVGEIDNEGRWAYDSPSGRLYIMSPDGPPQNIEASQLGYGIRVNSGVGYNEIRDLNIRYFNTAGIYVGSAHNITIAGNLIDHIHEYGIRSSAGNDLTIAGNTISFAGSAAIRIDGTDRTNIEANTIYAAGVEELGGDLLSGRGIGIYVIDGEGSSIYNNRVDRTGYTGIHITNGTDERNRTISYNYVTNSMLALDDGAGIYYSAGDAAYPGHWDYIQHNIVEDTWGYYEGTPRAGQPRSTASQASGIYLDETTKISDYCVVTDNTAINANHSGIFLHDTRDMVISDNTLYSNKQQQILITDWRGQGRNNDLNGNILFATDPTQETLRTTDLYAQVDFGKSDYNYYQGAGNSAHIEFQTLDGSHHYTLSGWRSLSGLDAHSVEIPSVSAGETSRILTNPTLQTVVIDLGGQQYVDVQGNVVVGTVTLDPFESKILIGSQVDAPIVEDLTIATNEDTAAGAVVTGSDPNGSPLTFFVDMSPAHGSVVMSGDGAFTYKPQADWHGQDSFTFRARNGLANSAAATVTIAVTAVNDAPLAGDLTVRTDDSSPVTAKAVGSDVDGDELTFAVVTGPSGGSATMSPDGSFTYTPGPAWGGSDSFTFRAYDGQVYSAAGTVSIVAAEKIYLQAEDGQMVSPWQVYADPAASAGRYAATPNNNTADWSVPEGKDLQLSFEVAHGGDYVVWGRTIAPTDNDNSFWVSMDGGAWGLWDVPVTGNWAWHNVTNRDVAGPTTFTLSAGTHTLSLKFREDGTAIDSLLITDDLDYVPQGTGETGNTPPVAYDLAITTDEDAPVASSVSGSDADGDELTFSLVSAAAHGSVSMGSDGSFTYTPDDNWNGQDTFTFKAGDGQADSPLASVVIEVNPINDAPVADDLAIATDQNKAASGLVTGSDADGDELAFYVVTAPAHGSVSMHLDGSFAYTPDVDWNGQDTFAFKAGDGQADSQTAAVAITVAAATAPVEISLEAEAGVLSSPWGVFYDRKASGGSYIESPDAGVFDWDVPGGKEVRYHFEVTDGGTYAIWGRTLAPTDHDNSFFVSLDGGDWILWDLPIKRQWSWNEVIDRGASTAASFDLSAGSHTLTIKNREDGSKLDKLVITNKPDYTPVDPPGKSKIRLEAEDAVLGSPWEVVSQASASGGKYIEAPDAGVLDWDVPDGKEVRYNFELSHDGSYVVWARTIAPTDHDNSFFASVDGGDWIVWDLSVTNDWNWNEMADRGASGPAIFELAAGTHSLILKSREDGTKLDELLITDILDYDPRQSDEPGIYLEAEDGAMGSPWGVFSDGSASGGEYMGAPNAGVLDWNVPDGKEARYSFEVSRDGSYVVWGRTIAPTDHDNSFFISIDGGDWILWDLPVTSDWNWNEVTDRDASAPASFSLSAGLHTLIVKHREDGSSLDQLFITDDWSYIPVA